ncbi:MAG: hypothetical protein IT512_11000 [Rhodocyclaceae bacterium]|nr:hypothetical protein [Rhodocyclaceae bacterium]
MRASLDVSSVQKSPFLHVLFLAVGFLAIWGLPWPRGLVGVAPIGWVLSRWIVFGFSHFKRHAYEKACAEWQGKYFEFDGMQMRIECTDEEVRVAADDIFRLLGVQPGEADRRRLVMSHGAVGYRREPGVPDTFSEEAVLAYLAGRRDKQAPRLRAWLERQVFANLRARRERGLPPQ